MRWKLLLRPRVSDGLSCPRPEVTIWVRSRYSDFVPVRFVVDTGADVTALPLAFAKREGIPVDQSDAAAGKAWGLVGSVEKYLGTIHVRIGGEGFDWPCNFLATSSPASSSGYGVLGRAAFLDAFRIAVDRPYLTLERRMNHRPL